MCYIIVILILVKRALYFGANRVFVTFVFIDNDIQGLTTTKKGCVTCETYMFAIYRGYVASFIPIYILYAFLHIYFHTNTHKIMEKKLNNYKFHFY